MRTEQPASASDLSFGSRYHQELRWLRIYSLVGVVPVVSFLVFHLLALRSGLHGSQPFFCSMSRMASSRYQWILELLLIVFPIAVQVTIGLWLDCSDRGKSIGVWGKRWRKPDGIMSIGAFCFIGLHVYQLRFQRWLGRAELADFYEILTAMLSSTFHAVPVMAILYLCGLTAVVFHLTTGLRMGIVSWGLVRNAGADRIVSWLLRLGAVCLWLAGVVIVLYFATGSRLF